MLKNYKIQILLPIHKTYCLDILISNLKKQSIFKNIDEFILFNFSKNINDTQIINSFCIDNFKLYSKNIIQNDIQTYFYNTSDNTICIKIKDNICWMDTNCLKNLIDFRIKYLNFFMIYSMVINSGLADFIYGIMGKFSESIFPFNILDKRTKTINIGDFSIESIMEIHRCFLKIIQQNNINKLFFEKYLLTNYENVLDNIVCWFAKDLSQLNNINIYENNFFTKTEPFSRQLISSLCASSIASCFTNNIKQEEYLLRQTLILLEYKELCKIF